MLERIPQNAYKISLETYFSQQFIDPRMVQALYLGYCNNINVIKAYDSWFDLHHSSQAKAASFADYLWFTTLQDRKSKIVLSKNISQAHIKKQLILICKKFDIASEEFLEKLNRGYCSGFSTLVSYAFILEFQPKRFKNGSPIPRDDWTWLKDLFEKISGWFHWKMFTDQELIQIKRLLTLLEYFQNITFMKEGNVQGDNQETVNDTRGNKIHRVYTLATKANQKDTETILSNLYSAKPAKEDKQVDMVDANYAIVTSHDHDVSIIQVDGKIFYYDPNNILGPIEVCSADLGFLLFITNYHLPDLYSLLGYRFFSFQNNRAFPPQKDLLNNTSLVIDNKVTTAVNNNSCGDQTVLDLAAWIGCIASFDFYRSHGLNSTLKHLPVRTEFINHLFSSNPNFESLNCLENYGIFHTAVEKNNLALARSILQRDKSRANQPTFRWKKFPLHIAVFERLSDMISLLLEFGANPDELDNCDRSAFEFAVDTKSLAILKAFNPTSTQLEKRNKNGNTFLAVAILLEDIVKAEILLAVGANPSVQFGIYTPLHFCVIRKNFQMVRLLLKYKADVNVIDSEGKKPIDYATNEEMRKLLQGEEKQDQYSPKMFKQESKPGTILQNSKSKAPSHPTIVGEERQGEETWKVAGASL